MKRARLTSAALLYCLAFAPAAIAQSSKSAASTPKKDATPAVAPAPPAPPSPELMKARTRPPVKGTASVDYILAKPKVVKDEIVMTMQVKNTSNAPIVGFRVDVYFYKAK